MTLDELQAEHKKWADYNFPNALPYEPLLGVGEEVGELMHAHLKQHQGIRGTEEEWMAKKCDAIGDIAIYLMDYCSRHRISFWQCILVAWREVSKRDWIKFPRNGKTE